MKPAEEHAASNLPCKLFSTPLQDNQNKQGAAVAARVVWGVRRPTGGFLTAGVPASLLSYSPGIYPAVYLVHPRPPSASNPFEEAATATLKKLDGNWPRWRRMTAACLAVKNFVIACFGILVSGLRHFRNGLSF